MQPDVTPFFTIATTSSGLPSIAIRFWKGHCASGYEPSFGRSARNWEYRSSQAFCPKSMSTCSSRYHRISRSATSFAVPKGARRIAFRWRSQNFANDTGVAFLGEGLLLHYQRQHHRRGDTSVSQDSRRYRRQPVGIQLPFIADGVPGFQGPLAGILAALDWIAPNYPDVRFAISAAPDM